MLVLHGLLGSGRNWAAVARRVIDARPGWGALLVDLREHGRSTGTPAPHTLAAAAADLSRLVAALGMPVTAVLGHSFGGKVALQYAAGNGNLYTVFVIDSTPAPVADPGQAGAMLGMLRDLPGRFTSRDEAHQAMVQRGTSPQTAQWMAMNLVHDGAGYHWRLDFDSIHQLHASFRQADLWHVPVQNPAITFHFLRATAGSVITPAVADQLRNLALNVHLHEVPGGHWLNIDNPAAVVDVIAGHLPTSTSQSGA